MMRALAALAAVAAGAAGRIIEGVRRLGTGAAGGGVGHPRRHWGSLEEGGHTVPYVMMMVTS